MPFDSGAISFRRFAVVGASPKAIDQDLLDKLSEHALRPADIGAVDVEYGWSGGRHILDADFSFENNVFADALHFAMRVDTNRVPSELKKAYQLMEEEAAAANNPSGFISKQQRRDARDVVRRKIDDDLRSGQFRRSKLTSILWDVPAAVLYTTASPSAEEKLREIFERTFGLELAPITAGSAALRALESTGRRRDVEDLRPTRFAATEDESQSPDYPWIAKSADMKDFLGNEFLLWLWHEADVHDGYVPLSSNGHNGNGNGNGHAKSDEIAVMFDRSLDLECAFAITGKTSLRASGPTKLAEAAAALRTGKVPRRGGVTMESAGSLYTFNLNAETLAVSGLKMPEIADAESPRVLFEERIAQLRDFGRSLDKLFLSFLKQRTSSWEAVSSNIRRWVTNPSQKNRVAQLAADERG